MHQADPDTNTIPDVRVSTLSAAPYRGDGEYVLYWMTSFRRVGWNFALDRAIEWARELRRPLMIFEPLRVDYPWACDRFHRFVIDGMADNAAQVAASGARGVLYYPYVEPAKGAAKGLLAALAERASVVVTDDYPAFFIPHMLAAAAKRLDVRLERVDSNGIWPLRATTRVFTTAFSFRAHLQKELPPYLAQTPAAEPLEGLKLPPLEQIPDEISSRWPPVSQELLDGSAAELARLPIDHTVGVVETRGGTEAARERMTAFLARAIGNYAEESNHPDEQATSRLSPYLHFGHISSHEVFHRLATQEGWTPDKLAKPLGGKREGWWNMSPSAEAWLDQLITWREIGFNMAAHADNYDRYESLPAWARQTLDEHSGDTRPHIYPLDELAAATTYDPVWNAAQRQLVREGQMHNYLRMLWGKKILQWTPSPRDALAILVELNNRYALDGRDPNSYSGIFWTLGRYDRAWGPEREIFGKIRYMSSDSAVRKLRMKEYLARYGQ